MSQPASLHLAAGKALLLLVDLQEKLMPPVLEWSPIVPAVGLLLAGQRLLGLPFLHTEHYPKGLGPTYGPVAAKLAGRAPVEKITFSCCRDAGFMRALEATGRRQVILAGLETHICVYLTALDLVERGYEVYVPTDAVASRRGVNWTRGLEMCETAGAALTTTETALFQMFERADGAAFKEFARLLKDSGL